MAITNIFVASIDKDGDVDPKSIFKIDKPEKPIDSRWITVFCNHCNGNVQVPYEEYENLLLYDKPLHCPVCKSKDIRLLSENDKDSGNEAD